MSVQPRHNRIWRRAFRALRQGWTVDHQDRQAKRAGGVDFGFGPSPTCVFADDAINRVGLEQRDVVSGFERPTRHSHGVLRQARRFAGRINQAQDVVMLRLGSKSLQMHATKGQHDAFGGCIQRGNGGVDVRHVVPVIPRFSLPRRTCQGGQWRSRFGAGVKRVPAHLCGKRVCGINDMADVMVADVTRKTLCPAKPTVAHGHGLLARVGDAACVAERGTDALISYGLRKRAGLCRAAKNKEMLRHV